MEDVHKEERVKNKANELRKELLSQRLVIRVSEATVEQTPRQPSGNRILEHHYTQIQRHLHTQ